MATTAVTVEELVNRFDDLVAAVERIADACEAALADDVATQSNGDPDDQGNNRQTAE